MRKTPLFIAIVILMAVHLLARMNPTYLQILYSVKKVFPETKEVHLLIAQDALTSDQSQIERASAQNQIKTIIHPIRSLVDINKAIQEISEKQMLILPSSRIFQANATRLYILKKVKEKGIILVTTSAQYSNSGALLGVLPMENHKTKIVINLKHNPQLKAHFNRDFVEQSGIAEVIQ